MPRVGLSWYRCDVCGRKSYVYTCRFQGRIVHLCPYCITIFAGKRGFTCGFKMVKRLAGRAYEEKWAKADLLASRLDSGLTASRRSKSAKRWRGRRR